MLKHSLTLAAMSILAACAVSSDKYVPVDPPKFEAPENKIAGTFGLTLANPSSLMMEAKAMGVTCSAVPTTGNFEERFKQIANSAFESVFSEEGGASYAIEMTPLPTQPRIMQLRRSYMTGAARVQFSIGAEVSVKPGDGETISFAIPSEDTAITTNSERSMGCETNGVALASAFDESATLLMNKVTTELAKRIGAN